VLYDAVVLLLCDEEADAFAEDPVVRDFVSDAFAHCKMIGYTAAAMPVLEAAGVATRMDAGVIELAVGGLDEFLDQCRVLRYWERELATVSVG